MMISLANSTFNFLRNTVNASMGCIVAAYVIPMSAQHLRAKPHKSLGPYFFFLIILLYLLYPYAQKIYSILQN